MTDNSSLAGKYAIVTGSTQGLGEAIARLFVERGAAGIIICGRHTERGKAVEASLNSEQCEVRFVQADLASVEDCRRIVAAAARWHSSYLGQCGWRYRSRHDLGYLA